MKMDDQRLKRFGRSFEFFFYFPLHFRGGLDTVECTAASCRLTAAAAAGLWVFTGGNVPVCLHTEQRSLLTRVTVDAC